MERRAVLVAALAVLLATAGCQAPGNPGATSEATTTVDATSAEAATTDATTTATSTATTATVEGPPEQTEHLAVTDELPFEVGPIYRRVGRMLGVAESSWPYAVVRVREPPEGGSLGEARTTGFTNLVGIAPLPSAGEDGGVITGAVARGTEVTLYDHPNASATFQQNVLAHEFVHVLQTRMDVESAVAELDLRRSRAFLRTVLVEGSAEYVQERYAIRHQNSTLDQTEIPRNWKNASAYVRFRVAPYEYGSRYFAMRVDDASQVTDVYSNPPRTAEQVLHGYAPDEERALDLTATGDGSGTAFAYEADDTRGELFLRLALSSELEFDRAAAAAAGWGMDRLLRFEADDGDEAYAWVIRWDDASEAEEFSTAFRDYDAGNNVTFAVESVTDETVVVYAGDDAFVESASASGSTSNVTVSA